MPSNQILEILLQRADFEKSVTMNGTAISDADIMAESYADPGSGLPPGGGPPPPPPPPPSISGSSVLPPGALNQTSATSGGGGGASGVSSSSSSSSNGGIDGGGGGGGGGGGVGGGSSITNTNDIPENGCALSVLPPGALTVSNLCENGALSSNGSPGCLMNSSGSPGSRITCRFCGKRFSQSGYVKAHERIHTGEKPFHCSVCGKQFSDPSNWKKHERVHTRQMSEATNEKSHLLKQSINNLPSLVQPRRIKAESPSNTCKICGKMFSSQSSLATHRRIHTGERPYKCLTCGKAFTQVGTLRTHERVHTGEKPYQCKICGRTFAQCGSYKMHERRHMSMTYRRCRLCQMTFGSWPELQDHVATHHANQYNPALIYSLSDGQGTDIGMPNGDYDHTGGSTPPGSLIIDPDEGKPDYSSHIPLAYNSPDVSKSLAKASLSPMSNAPSLNAFVPQSINSIAQSINSKSFTSSMDHPEDLSTHSLHSENIKKSEISEGQENIPPNQEPVDMITTVNRHRRFSSESIISSSNRETNSNQIFRYETSHYDNLVDADITATNLPHQSPENSSICSSKSPDGALFPDNIAPHEDGGQQLPSAITRLNLNSRMMPSSSSTSSSTNTRKQKHPMRRCSSTNGSDYDNVPQSSSPSPGLVVMSQKDRDADDQSMLTYLILKGKVFKCVHCHIVFDDCSTYVLHNGFHSHNGEPFRCGICHIICKDRIDFNCHLTSHIK